MRMGRCKFWVVAAMGVHGWMQPNEAVAAGTLADPIMQPDRDPIGMAQMEHVYFSREAANGGRTVGGGGCGCN